MKKIVSVVIVLSAFFLMVSGVLADTEVKAGTAENQLIGGGEDVMLVGGWAAAEDAVITDEISSLLEKALDDYQTGMITITYTPVAYLGSQLVAGTNHAILCRTQEINKTPFWTIVYLYEDLEDNVTILDITALPLGIQ